MMQKQTVAMLTHAALATRYGLPTPTFEQGVSALEKGISRKITPRSEPAGQSQTVRVKDCLEVADFGSRLLDYNRVFAKVAWKVDIANSCDLAFAVRVRFALQDAEEYEVDHDTKDIRIPPNGIGKARGDMLVSPSEGYKRVEFNGVSFTLLQ